MLLGIIIAFFVCLAFYLGINIKKGFSLVSNVSHPKKSKIIDIDNIQYKTNKFHFNSQDGIQLSAIEYIPEQESKGTIIACHYLGGSKVSIYTYIEPLIAKGYRVVSFDYPNHGESDDRKGIKYTLNDDIRRFVLKLKERGIKGPFGSIGFSMGASLTLNLPEYLPEIKAVIVDSGPLLYAKDYFLYVLKNKEIKNKIIRIVFLFTYLYIIGFYKNSRKMKKHLMKTCLPVLMVHSKNDKIISYKNVEYAYSLINSKNKKLITLEKAHHLTAKAILGEAYDNMIIDFFDKWLIENE